MLKTKGTLEEPRTGRTVQTVQTHTTQNRDPLKGLTEKSIPENPNKQET